MQRVRKAPSVVMGKLGGAGEGQATVNIIEPPDGLNKKGRMFSHIVLDPGASISYHQHTGDTEWYYIIKGEGVFNDNGKEVQVSGGDVCETPHGESHSLKNTGDNKLEMIALVLFS